MSVNAQYLIGIDVGTSGLKSVLIDLDGHILGQSIREYAPHTPHPGYAEQNPDDWLDAALSAVREVVDRTGCGAGVAGIGFSGQMHSAVFLDADRRPACPAMLWLDTRAAAEVDAIRERFGTSQLAEWIGNPVMVGVTLASLLWLKAHDRSHISAGVCDEC